MHRFRVTVGPAEQNSTSQPISFEVENHDDILAIVSRLSGKLGLTGDESKSFAVGLKLFGEVVLKNRQRPPFDQIRPAMAGFMKALKRQVAESEGS